MTENIAFREFLWIKERGTVHQIVKKQRMFISSENMRHLFEKVRPYFGLALDFDDTLADSEIVTARVTADLLNPFLLAAGQPLLTAEAVCREYSGLSFTKQVALLEKRYGIDVPPEVLQQKKQRNLEALAKDALSLPGSENFLSLIQEFRFNAMILTASEPDRVAVTAQCAGLTRYLTIEDLHDDPRIPVISTGVSKEWRGQVIPALSSKPAPDGYLFVAQALGLKPEQMIACEDSDPGVRAAVAAEYERVAIISLSRRCSLIADHASSLRRLASTPEQAVVVDSSWVPVAQAMLEIGLKNARIAGVEDLPETLPLAVTKWLEERLPVGNKSRPQFEVRKEGVKTPTGP